MLSFACFDFIFKTKDIFKDRRAEWLQYKKAKYLLQWNIVRVVSLQKSYIFVASNNGERELY